ncbi:AAA ATPase [Fimicolochytrium jonesii]|uniref:AAA ATPase n=1 Tax=Fimicolochytrium jonesii TaxID=1396493 RepID=UPI0022FE61EE|nr:AAA ATPase [Fimicolochytrium jonesii]KAI8816588.1 AAA ATPase [Fimicolochytrium jonesii]
MTQDAAFFSAVLTKPLSAIPYTAHTLLTQLTGGKRHIIQGADKLFDIQLFASLNRCTLTPHPNIHNQSSFSWEPRTTDDSDVRALRARAFGHGGIDSIDVATGNAAETLKETILAGWYDVQWEGNEVEVVVMRVPKEYCEMLIYFVAAETKKIGERFVVAVESAAAELGERVWVFEKGFWEASSALYKAVKGVTFDTLISTENKARAIKEDLERFFDSRELYLEYGLPWKRGFLLSGPPGNGKTHIIKSLINHFTSTHPTISILYVKSFKAERLPDEYAISAVFKRARSNPCLLILEDLDTLITDANRAFFLNEMDGLNTNAGVVVLATTNYPERLDPAIRDRPSRFDRRYEFGLPTAGEREMYVQMWGRTKAKKGVCITDELAREIAADDVTGGFSFAYLKELLVSSVMRWVQGQVQDGGHGGKDFGTVLRDEAAVLKTYIREMQAKKETGKGEKEDGKVNGVVHK